MKLSNEAKVGLLLLGTMLTTVSFAWLLGARNPFRRSVSFYVTYNFAGGIEVGSPVRVAGIKVGKVEKIEFFTAETPALKANPQSAEPFDANAGRKDLVITPLKIKVSVAKEAAEGVREDSKFYVNLAGIIGERYIEITPGTFSAKKIENGSVMRGVDPPRIDQLISQSFDLAGKIKEVIEENEGDITKSIKLLYQLSANVNKTLQYVDQSKLFKTDLAQLINNLIVITADVKALTSKTQSTEGKKTLELLYNLLWRLEPLDADKISKFLQKEGIRARLF